jgi:hypothetical protein
MAHADRLVAATRQDLGLSHHDRLDPGRLASHLGIELCPLTDLHPVCPDAVRHLTEVDIAAFSGTLLERDGHRAIFLNNAQPPTRQASTIAHECAHLLLDHDPSDGYSEPGVRHYDKAVEEEADWLGSCLLVPTPGIASALCAHRSVAGSAGHFGVSASLMQRRVYLTGSSHMLEEPE